MTNPRDEDHQTNEGKEKNNLSSSVYQLCLFIFLRSLPNVLRTTHAYICTTFSDEGKHYTVADDDVMKEDSFVIRWILISEEGESLSTICLLFVRPRTMASSSNR